MLYLLLKELFFHGFYFLIDSCWGMGDSVVTVQSLWFVAEPGLPCVELCVVAQLLFGSLETYVARSSFSDGAWAKEAFKIKSVRLLLGQLFQHCDCLTRMNQGHLLGTNENKRKDCEVWFMICNKCQTRTYCYIEIITDFNSVKLSTFVCVLSSGLKSCFC